MTEPHWLLESAVLAVHSMLLDEHGGANGIRDQDMLASALSRAKKKISYDAKHTLFDLAAAYSFGVAKNHPFFDGNKRTAFLCGTLFLELNGYQFSAAEADAAATFEQLAAGTINEIDLSLWLERNSNET